MNSLLLYVFINVVAISLHYLLTNRQNALFYSYPIWLWLGVVASNGSFLYRVGYLGASLAGVFISPFFYAGECSNALITAFEMFTVHLIDLVLSFPMLKAILQSVTHNLSQVGERNACGLITQKETNAKQ